jgi:predicted RNA binding protein YcfA (HicA-like mRNA interferase family)
VSRPPLVSSRRAVKALERLGFEKAHTKGSHLTMRRDRADGGTDVLVIVLDRKQLPRGTLASALRQGRVSVEEFVNALK